MPKQESSETPQADVRFNRNSNSYGEEEKFPSQLVFIFLFGFLAVLVVVASFDFQDQINISYYF